MDVRTIFLAVVALVSMSSSLSAQLLGGRRAVVETPNFRIYATDPSIANAVAQMAESNRRDLAIYWLGAELPAWHERCPIHVDARPNLPASGETNYTLVNGEVRNFRMVIRGTQERVLDSVLPHEMTHTILASYFARLGKPVPRWADEGACTTVEHASERSKHDAMLVQFLSQGRGIPFATLFTLREYPRDIMPLYAQGYSLSCFLISQGGPQHFVKFLERGMESDDWVGAIEEFYEYPMLGKLQVGWNGWVADGGGAGNLQEHTAVAMGLSKRSATLASNTRGRNDSDVRLAAATIPVATAQDLSASFAQNKSLLQSSSQPVSQASAAFANGSNSGSYYLRQFEQQQQQSPSLAQLNAEPPAATPRGRFVPAAASPSSNDGHGSMPYVVSHPAPSRTIGGGIRR